MNLSAVKKALEGKKTFGAVGIGAIYLLGCWVGWWEFDERVLYAVGLGGLAFVRAALPKANGTNTANGTNAQSPTASGLMPALALVAVLGLVGCSSVAPGNDPVVVRAEQTIKVTFDLADTFLSWEESNRAIVPEDVQEFADEFRDEFPKVNRSAWALLKTYKANRTEANRANLETALKTLEALKSEVLKYFSPPPQARVVDQVGSKVLAASVPPVVVLAAIDGLIKLIALISGLIATARKDKEWTREEEAEIEARMEEAFTKASHWQKRPKAVKAKD